MARPDGVLRNVASASDLEHGGGASAILGSEPACVLKVSSEPNGAEPWISPRPRYTFLLLEIGGQTEGAHPRAARGICCSITPTTGASVNGDQRERALVGSRFTDGCGPERRDRRKMPASLTASAGL